MNIYHKLKVSCIIRHVILVKELLILQVQKNALLSTNHVTMESLLVDEEVWLADKSNISKGP
jgi:hypothetical protein